MHRDATIAAAIGGAILADHMDGSGRPEMANPSTIERHA